MVLDCFYCFYVFTMWVNFKSEYARKCHTHTLKINPQHREEESKNNNSPILIMLPPGWGPFDNKTTIWTNLVEYHSVMLHIICQNFIGHWLDMVYLPPPPRGNFVDHVYLKFQCLARILQHISPLTMAALSCNSLLYTLPYKIFDN